MKKLFYLSTCNSCKKLMDQIDLSDVALRDLKNKPVTEQELKVLYDISGSYESLFNKRSRQWSALGLKDKALGEQDFHDLLLKEYTFLKRPMLVQDKMIFTGKQIVH